MTKQIKESLVFAAFVIDMIVAISLLSVMSFLFIGRLIAWFWFVFALLGLIMLCLGAFSGAKETPNHKESTNNPSQSPYKKFSIQIATRIRCWHLASRNPLLKIIKRSKDTVCCPQQSNSTNNHPNHKPIIEEPKQPRQPNANRT